MPSKPLILAGHGTRCAGIADHFRRFVDDAQTPTVLTQLAKDLLPYDHPLFIGHCGVRGDRAGNLAVQKCDYLLVLGASLHEQTTGYDRAAFAPNAQKVVVGDLREPFCYGRNPVSDWLAQCQSWKARYPVSAEPHLAAPPDGPANIYEFVDLLSDLAPSNATILTDAGCAYYIMGQAFRCKEGQRYLAPGSLAEMGWCMPACTGAAFAAPDRTIIGVTGDGSFQTNVHELAVWAHHGLNVKLFVLDNGGYSCIRATQENYCGGNLVGVDKASGVGLPYAGDVAGAYGLPSFNAPNRQYMAGEISRTLGWRGPVVCVVKCRADQQFMPQVSSWRDESGVMRSGKLEAMWPPLEVAEPLIVAGV